jgi:CheY-like chemotaxis protein
MQTRISDSIFPIAPPRNALQRFGPAPADRKGLKMTDESMAREHLILELGDIHRKLTLLVRRTEDTDGLSQELASLGARIEQLIDGFKAEDASPKDGPENKVILVVDDNDELRKFVKQALELSGFNVLDTPDGEATITLLQNTEALDLAICDVILPDEKGPELGEQIRGLFPDVKLIFMSGYVTEDIVSQDVEQILAAGGFFLQKPFPTRKLLGVVHDMLGI